MNNSSHARRRARYNTDTQTATWLDDEDRARIDAMTAQQRADVVAYRSQACPVTDITVRYMETTQGQTMIMVPGGLIAIGWDETAGASGDDLA